ncbi:MAG: PilZ domain-containing protein [Candidatus Polarisedimenticolaceae bacterium]|nr:PilZ domain-containing protein [Candidatus Polarisedimenticolaceae bacterium]
MQSNDERRNFHRVIFDTPVTLTQGDQQWQTQLIDISLKGALVNKPEAFSAESGSEALLEIKFDGSETIVSMHTTIAHIDEEHIGLGCHQIDMGSITFLRRLIELNLGDANLLARDLQALSRPPEHE